MEIDKNKIQTAAGTTQQNIPSLPHSWRRHIVVIAFLLLTLPFNQVRGQATHFVAILGNTMYNEGVATCVLNDTVYLVIGNSMGFQNSSGIWLGWIDNHGNLLKDVMISRAWSITAASTTLYDSIIHIAGHAYKGQQYQHMVLRINTRGEVLTERYWGGPGWRFLHGITVTPNYNIYVAGSSTDTLFGTTSGLAAALDSSGTLLWEKQFGGSHNDIFFSIDTGHAQTLIMGGYTGSYSLYSDSALWVVKTNLSGDLIWDFVRESPGPEHVAHLLASSLGGYIACGRTYNNNADNHEAFLLHLDEYGTEQWFSGMIGGATENAYYHVLQQADGSYRMAGYYAGQYAAGDRDFFFQNANTQGYWMPGKGGIIKGGKNDDIAYHATETPDNGFVITGTTRSHGPGITHIMVLKTDSIASNSPLLPHQTNTPGTAAQTRNTTVKAWPIPAMETLNISIKETTIRFSREITVTITDFSGRTIANHLVSHNPGETISIPVAGIASGIYLLHVDNDILKITIQ